MPTQILALGGAEFGNRAINQYILAMASKPRPKVCFVGTASGDAESNVEAFQAGFTPLDCEPIHLSLFRPPTADLLSFVLDCDIVYVGGGNTKSMLAVWREWGFDQVMREAWQQGVALCGFSAGAICWFEGGPTDSIPGALTPIKCLGFLEGSACPHYDSQPARRPAYQEMVATGKLSAGYAADETVGLHFTDGILTRIVSTRRSARAYRVEGAQGYAIESVIEPTVLSLRATSRQTTVSLGTNG